MQPCLNIFATLVAGACRLALARRFVQESACCHFNGENEIDWKTHMNIGIQAHWASNWIFALCNITSRWSSAHRKRCWASIMQSYARVSKVKSYKSEFWNSVMWVKQIISHPNPGYPCRNNQRQSSWFHLAMSRCSSWTCVIWILHDNRVLFVYFSAERMSQSTDYSVNRVYIE